MSTPCDEAIEVFNEETGRTEKRHICPYEGNYTGYADEICRVCCGLGVDG